LDIRPAAWCPTCDRQVAAVQTWKLPDRPWGRYRQQYVYRCPNVACRHQIVEPYALAAATAIDWSMPGLRIGDRAKPLSPKTIARIEAGLRRYAGRLLVPSGGTWNEDARPVAEPFRSRTTRENEGVLVPVEGRDNVQARPTAGPMRAQTARLQDALVVPYYGSEVEADPADEPLRTLTAHDRFGLAFIAELRGGGSNARPVEEPLATVTASGQHHMLVRHNNVRSDPGYLCTPVSEPARSITTAGHQSLVGFDVPPAVEDCTFRMLEPTEIQAAMAFRPDYGVLGNRREKVRQLGNAVTPPAAEYLVRAVADALQGEAAAA